MALSKSVNLEHAQTAVPCNVCEDEAPGEYYCIECKHTLCQQCDKLHRKFTKGHNVVLRTQLGSIDTTVLTCTDHGDTPSFHCERCNILVCGTCITGKHRGHEMSDLDDLLNREKKVLQHDITRMEESLSKFKKERENIIAENKKYDDKIRQITSDMETEIKSAHKEIDRIHNERMENLASIRQKHSSIYDGRTTEVKNKIEILEERITEYKATVRNNSLPALIHLSKRNDSIPEIRHKPEILEPPVFVPGNLHKLGNYVGKLQISSSTVEAKTVFERYPLKLTSPTIVSKFKYPLQRYPCICITKEGDVLLGGYDSRELHMVNIKGQVLRRMKIKNRPYALAVRNCGDVIISPHHDDSSSVSRLLRDGREQHVFDTSPSAGTAGVSVTPCQNILICTRDGRVVKINADGTNAKQIYKGSDDYSLMHAVENEYGYIFIGDRTKGAVLVMSRNGKLLSTIRRTEEEIMIWPLGLLVDKMGNTLCSDPESHELYIINQKLQMMTLIDSSFGLVEPRWMVVDNDYNLWVIQNDGSVLVVKYIA